MPKITERRKQECITELKKILKPGDTVYTILRHVSKSGMYRVINLVVIEPGDAEQPPSKRKPWIRRIDHLAADLLEGYDRRHEGCKASGAGMDMGFHLVYNLSHVLFKGGYGCIGEGCPSNAHSNGDRDFTPHNAPHPTREGETMYHWHKSGGYALKHEWI